jgi:hypothetical protein
MWTMEQLDTTGLGEKYDEWVAFIAKTHHGSNPRRNDPVPFARPPSRSPNAGWRC